jgi:hypothetical protein
MGNDWAREFVRVGLDWSCGGAAGAYLIDIDDMAVKDLKVYEFFGTMVEVRRIVRSDGGCSHMLTGALNHLRFREAI